MANSARVIVACVGTFGNFLSMFAIFSRIPFFLVMSAVFPSFTKRSRFARSRASFPLMVLFPAR